MRQVVIKKALGLFPSSFHVFSDQPLDVCLDVFLSFKLFDYVRIGFLVELEIDSPCVFTVICWSSHVQFLLWFSLSWVSRISDEIEQGVNRCVSVQVRVPVIFPVKFDAKVNH